MHPKVKNQIDKLNSVVSSIITIENLLADTANNVELNASDRSKAENKFSELIGIGQNISLSLEKLASSERFSDSRRLVSFGKQYFSAQDEDGIIAEIFQRIGTSNKTFVEIGPGVGRENNSLYLLLQNWNGFWLDKSMQSVVAGLTLLKKYVLNKSLQLGKIEVNADNVAGILADLRISDKPDFLSVSLTSAGYQILNACLKAIKPSVVSIKYDAQLGPSIAIVSDAGLGASLKSLEMLGANYGYSLVGCSIFGGTAFLVRNDLLGDKFAAPYTSENHFEPLRSYQKSALPEEYLNAVCMSENLQDENRQVVSSTTVPSIYCEGVENNVFISPLDQVIGRNILLNAEWEPFLAQLIKKIVMPGDIVFDIGANIGCHAVTFGKRVGSSGRVVAIEPEPTNNALLNHNVKINGCANQVSTFQMALSDMNGEISMDLSDWNMGDHRINLGESNKFAAGEKAERKQITLESLTLDDFIEAKLPGEL
ncbi:MAG: FkbM family methyltransferase [Candidatus Obscuribacterales bacterium]|nr:FkbM family methyltransferase [Candidatus Obscuribacterales bacterium]